MFDIKVLDYTKIFKGGGNPGYFKEGLRFYKLKNCEKFLR